MPTSDNTASHQEDTSYDHPGSYESLGRRRRRRLRRLGPCTGRLDPIVVLPSKVRPHKGESLLELD